MSFLKRLGQIALKVVVGIDTFAPLVKGFTSDRVDAIIDRVGDYTTQAADVIVQAEIMGQALQLGGSQKLKAAAPAMAQVILRSDAMVGKKIKDAATFERGVLKITDGWADVLNSLDDSDLPDAA